MWALGLDTSGLQLGVALCHGQRVWLRQSTERRTQGELVQGFIEELLAEAGITRHELAVVAAVAGPGSFTGLRLGLALAQGLTRGLAIPAAGYDRITLLRTAVGPEPVIVLDSLRDELFVDFGQGIAMMTVADIQAQLAGRPVVGDGAACLGLEPLSVAPEAVLAAQQALLPGQTFPSPQPLYVRPPDVTVARA